MDKVGPALLALTIAALVTALELVTTRYPQTFFQLKKCKELYIYALIYGLISGGVMLGLDQLARAGSIKLEGVGSNSLVQAVAIGVSTKALLHIRLFSVTAGSQTFPLGTESIVQLFEPWLLDQLALCEWNAVREFIQPREQNYPDLNAVKAAVKANLPATFAGPERVAFEVEVDRQGSVIGAMELYLRRFGERSFNRIFP